MTFQEMEQQKWEADEYYCVKEFLNKLNVPTQNENGEQYSTVGRIVALMKMQEPLSYPEQKLSKEDYVNSIIKKTNH